MRKQFKTAVVAAALMASVTGAFAADIANLFNGKVLQSYSWQKYLRNGTPDGSPLVNSSPNNPFAGECTGGSSDPCVVGTPEEGDPIIFYYPN